MVCGSRLKRNGTTSAGTVRWRCTECGGSSVKRRPDVVRAAQLDAFVSWLLGPSRQFEHGRSARTFRRRHAWCWNVDPVITVTGEVYDQVQLDGTYLNDGWCLLSAINGDGDVIAIQWTDEEKTASWKALLERIPAPRVVVCDGGPGLASALAECWTDTKIQRCLVHVQRNVRGYVTMNPRTEAGKGLRRLSLALTKIRAREQAADWLVALNAWHQDYKGWLDERTTATDPGAVRPTWVKATATSWFTHDRARKAYHLMARLAARGHLFTYLLEKFDGLGIASTTNHIEGGVNAVIKTLLRMHRGMTSHHQRRAIEWWAYLHSPAPKPSSSLIRPEHWQPASAPRPTFDDTTMIPGGWGATLTAEEGLWARTGWAGRTR